MRVGSPPRGRRRLGLLCLLAALALWPGAAWAGEPDAPHAATPLRIVNLNPFHLLYGVPAPFGARVLRPGTAEAIASLDMASYLHERSSDAEAVLLDGETYRQALALRHGLADGWEYLLEISAVSHSGGVFDGFIESWHDTFGLPQGGRDRAPRDRLAIEYVRDGRTLVGIDDGVSSLGDVILGVGHALPPTILANDGLALRGVVTLPTGDESRLTGSGGFSASVWAETSGALGEPAGPRTWLYSASLGALLGEAPESLAAANGRAIAFGRFGVTWQPLAFLGLTAQIDLQSSPYGASGLSPLADPVVTFGLGGTARLGERAVLDVAVTEDDGAHHAAPDIGLHVAMRWTL